MAGHNADQRLATPGSIDAAIDAGLLDEVLFGMGCDWGPDARLGRMDGVYQTRVGYAWGAFQLRRNRRRVQFLQNEPGGRWDEHLFATKLNALGEQGMDTQKWVRTLPPRIQEACRHG